MAFQQLWDSADKLGRLIVLANWGIAATLLIAFVCTAITIKAGSRKDDLTHADDLLKAGRIANLEHDNLTLRGQVATLEIAAGSTVKDLLRLQKAADDAKAAQQRVEIEFDKQ